MCFCRYENLQRPKKPQEAEFRTFESRFVRPAEGSTYTVLLSGLSSLQENSLRMAKYDRFGGAGVSGVWLNSWNTNSIPFLWSTHRQSHTQVPVANSKSAQHRPVDQDDALAELDEIAESEGESPGELSDAGERLDSRMDSTSALLLLFKPSEQLRRQQRVRMIGLFLNDWSQAESESVLDVCGLSFCHITDKCDRKTPPQGNLQITETVQEQKPTNPKTTAREKCLPHDGSAPGH